MPDRRPHVLVPILRAQGAPALLQVAEAMLRREGGVGHVLGVVEIPQGRDIAQSVTVEISVNSKINAGLPKAKTLKIFTENWIRCSC